MSRTRLHAHELARLLHAASCPVYVLDDEFTVVFANRACLEWLGVEAQELLGRRCKYRTPIEPTGPEAMAASLCPPPDVLSGKPATVFVAPPREVAAFYRRVRFQPLGEQADEVFGVVAIADNDDLSAPPISERSLRADPDAALHELVRHFRRESAGRYRADRIVGRSPAIMRAQRQVEAAVTSACSVLLVGPKGSGKRHLASCIHYGSQPDMAGALVPLDCPILDIEMIQSTVAALAVGASAGRPTGRSTLLFERVEELPAESQRALAELLSARLFPLRLVATSQQSLGELVGRGQFLAELASVLSTIVIELPALSARRGDIPPLAQLFLEEANGASRKQVARFSPEALDQLDAYPWPGNADELAAFVAEAHQRAGGVEVTPSDLPDRIRLAAKAAAHPRRGDESIVLGEYLARIERELIERAMKRAKGNKAKAARLLGITRPRLYRRMVQLGLEPGLPKPSIAPPLNDAGADDGGA